MKYQVKSCCILFIDPVSCEGDAVESLLAVNRKYRS